MMMIKNTMIKLEKHCKTGCKINVYSRCNDFSCKYLCEEVKLKYWDGDESSSVKPKNDEEFYITYNEFNPENEKKDKCVKNIDELGRYYSESIENPCDCGDPNKKETKIITCIDGLFNNSKGKNTCTKYKYNFVSDNGDTEIKTFDSTDMVEENNLSNYKDLYNINKYDEKYFKIEKNLKNMLLKTK